jgi:hypothetical protein
MPQPDLEALERDLRDLAQRVSQIERQLGADMPAAAAAAAIDQPLAAVLPETAALLPALGRALLGLAGAYLLRAFTESNVLPAAAGVTVGIVYALFWLVWAARTPAERRAAAALHSLTAAVVLAPLLWEATLRFHVVGTWAAGAILLLFTLFGLAVSWRKNLLIVATIATLAGLGTAAALLMATHDVLPFTFVFLAIGAAVETSACLDHWLSERWLAAIAADLAVLLATWLVTNEHGLPEAYAPISPEWLLVAQALLLVIYLSSTIVRTLLRGVAFTGFETVQCALAFAIGVGGGLRLSHAGPAIGGLAAACGLACYVVSFARLDRQGGHGRNFYTYSTFAILLTLAASGILLQGAARWSAWLLLATACWWAGGRFGRLTLEVHGAVYLWLALAFSGALTHAGQFLLGSSVWMDRSRSGIVAGALAAVLCYWLAVRDTRGRETWNFRVLRFAAAVPLVWLAAGISAGAFTAAYHGLFGAGATHAYCATMRTGVLALVALLVAWAGSRWWGLELSRLIYPLMLVGACRLLLVDLHQDRKPAMVLSLLLYGAALIVLPRLTRARAAERPAGGAAIFR